MLPLRTTGTFFSVMDNPISGLAATAAAPARIVLIARRRVVISVKFVQKYSGSLFGQGLPCAVMRTLAQQMNEFILK
jgi:hypothetical protein